MQPARRDRTAPLARRAWVRCGLADEDAPARVRWRVRLLTGTALFCHHGRRAFPQLVSQGPLARARQARACRARPTAEADKARPRAHATPATLAPGMARRSCAQVMSGMEFRAVRRAAAWDLADPDGLPDSPWLSARSLRRQHLLQQRGRLFVHGVPHWEHQHCRGDDLHLHSRIRDVWHGGIPGLRWYAFPNKARSRAGARPFAEQTDSILFCCAPALRRLHCWFFQPAWSVVHL